MLGSRGRVRARCLVSLARGVHLGGGARWTPGPGRQLPRGHRGVRTPGPVMPALCRECRTAGMHTFQTPPRPPTHLRHPAPGLCEGPGPTHARPGPATEQPSHDQPQAEGRHRSARRAGMLAAPLGRCAASPRWHARSSPGPLRRFATPAAPSQLERGAPPEAALAAAYRGGCAASCHPVGTRGRGEDSGGGGGRASPHSRRGQGGRAAGAGALLSGACLPRRGPACPGCHPDSATWPGVHPRLCGTLLRSPGMNPWCLGMSEKKVGIPGDHFLWRWRTLAPILFLLSSLDPPAAALVDHPSAAMRKVSPPTPSHPPTHRCHNAPGPGAWAISTLLLQYRPTVTLCRP